MFFVLLLLTSEKNLSHSFIASASIYRDTIGWGYFTCLPPNEFKKKTNQEKRAARHIPATPTPPEPNAIGSDMMSDISQIPITSSKKRNKINAT